MRYDVPQRSVLGSLLLIIYLDDINCTSNVIKLLLYVEDITMMMYISGKDDNNLIYDANNELVIVNKLIYF